MKKCTKCNEIKELTSFSKDINGKDGVRSRCKSCCNNRQKIYIHKNKEEIKIRNKEWRKKNKEHVMTYKRDNREKNRKYQATYAKRNPDKVTAKVAKRRAAKLQRTPHWLTEEDFKTIEKFYQYAKYLTDLTGERWEVDHIVPLQGKNISGLHVPNNLQVITREENLQKSNHY